MAFSSPRTWPWWLWVEHGVILGLVGWKSVQGLRSLRCPTLPPPAPAPPQPKLVEEQHYQPQTARTQPRQAGDESSASAAALPLEHLPGEVLTNLDRLKALAGPPGVLTWPQVRPAPPASMDVETLENGQAASHHDSRGSIFKFKVGEGVYVNMYFTKAGYRRSGDLHDCNQYDVVLQGRTRLRMIDPHTGREVVQEYGANDFIVIPARTPHMFEFLEDNYLLEWWDDSFRAWYYLPYREVIEKGLPLAATEGSSFNHQLLP